MITSGQQNVVIFTHLISKEVGNNKFYVKNVLCKMYPFFKIYTAADLFYLKNTQRTLGHSKSTPRAVGNSWHLSSQALKHSGTWRSLEHSNTQGTWALGHWSTWGTRPLEGHLGTEELGHLGTWRLEALYLADSFYIKATALWLSLSAFRWPLPNHRRKNEVSH